MGNLGGRKVIEAANPEWKQTEAFDRSSETAVGDSSVATLTQQWAIANQRALKIGIRAGGWYRLTQPQIAALGFDLTGDARNLQLFVEGNEMAISVTRDSGPLRVIPGSHRRHEPPIDTEHGYATEMGPHPDEVKIIAPAGSVILFDAADLWHSGTFNYIPAARLALTVHLAPGPGPGD